MNWLFRIKPEKVAADLLYESRRAVIEHEAHAEYHAAMAAMHRQRIARLDPRDNEPKVGAGVPALYPVGDEWPPRQKWDAKAAIYRDTTEQERAEIMAMQRNATAYQFNNNPEPTK